MQRTLNVSLLVKTLAVLVVMTIVVYYVHGYQVRRNAHSLLERADKAHEKTEFNNALTYYGQYLALEPDDDVAREKFALTLDQVAGDANERVRVILRFEDILRNDPTRSQVRYRLALNLMALARYKDAILHLQNLLPDWQDPAEVHHLTGLCQAATSDNQTAAKSLADAIAKSPNRIDSYVLLAEVQHLRLGEEEEAVKTMDQMLSANPKSFRAFLARSSFERQRGHLAESEKYLAEAVAVAPDEPRVLLATARDAELRGKFDEARKLAQRGLTKDAKNVELYLTLADVEIRAGKRAEAIRVLEEGLTQLPQAAVLQVMLIDLLIDEKKLDVAARKSEELADIAPALTSYLKARLAIEAARWTEAIGLLEKARADLGMKSHWSSRVNALLGTCYEQVGDVDQRLAAFQRAVQIEPNWTAARYGLGLAALASGRADEALMDLDLVSKASNAPKEIWTALAKAQLQLLLRKAPAERNWALLEKWLAKSDQAGLKNADTALIRASMLAAQQKYEDARKLLTAEQAKDKQLVFAIAQAELDMREGHFDQALGILDEAQKSFGDSIDVRLARAGLYGQRGGHDDRAALQKLAEQTDKFTNEEQLRLLRGLAETWQRLGVVDVAERIWRDIAAKQPNDLRSRSLLLDAALYRNDVAAARTLLSELRRIEGDSGVQWRYGSAALQVVEARGATDKLDNARRLLSEVALRQRDWPRVPLLEGKIDEQQGQWERAIAHYLRAVELGERHPRTLQRLLNLLIERRMNLPAEQVLAKVEEQGPLTPELARVGAEIALANKNLSRVQQLIKQAVPAQPRDYRDLLWLARIHRGLDEPTKAEAYLRKATQVADHVPDTWIALVELLARTGQRQAIPAVLEQMQKKISPRRVAFALARCYEVAGNLDQAATWYTQAEAEAPNDFVVLAAAADFYRRADRLADAERFLDRLVEPALTAPPDVVAAARRQLALLAASRGLDTIAISLLDQNRKTLGDLIADQRVRWFVEGTQVDHRAKAIEQLKDSFRRYPSQVEEELLLARLYDSAEDFVRARDLLAQLVTSSESPQLLAFYIRALLKTDEVNDALPYFARLERFEPGSPRTKELKQAILRAKAKTE